MITQSLQMCGKAYIMTTVSTAFKTNAFAVVKLSCAVGIYSFGHEFGPYHGGQA